MNYVNVERWFTDLQNSQQPPNSRQMAVLQGVRALTDYTKVEVEVQPSVAEVLLLLLFSLTIYIVMWLYI